MAIPHWIVIKNVSRLFHYSYLLASKKCFHNKKKTKKSNNELTKTIHIKLHYSCLHGLGFSDNQVGEKMLDYGQYYKDSLYSV